MSSLLQRGGLGAKAGQAFIAATNRHPEDIARIVRRDPKTIAGMKRGDMTFEQVIEVFDAWNRNCEPGERLRFNLEITRAGKTVLVKRTPPD